MNKPTLTIFANFRINNEERLERMKNSFNSFKNINAKNWVINIRGKFKKDAYFFLKDHLNENLIIYELNSYNGWFYDSRIMLKDINSDFVFFWVEDHINLADISVYEEILKDMKKNDCDSLMYSWFCEGYQKRFNNLKNLSTTYFDIVDITKENINTIQKNIKTKLFIISAVSIFKTSFFKQIILSDNPIEKRWPLDTPFDFEKDIDDIEFLPIRHAVSKIELFAAIDDDNICEKNYNLIAKKIYESNFNREKIQSLEYDTIQKAQDTEYEIPYHHISKFRSNFSQCFNDMWGINYVATIEFLLNKLREEQFSSIVDIGCGDGRLTLELHREFRDKSKVLGIDYSQKAIRQARAVVNADLFQCMDITTEKLKEKFNIGLLVEVFEHINPTFAEEFVEGIYNLLDEGAILYITVPHVNKPVEYKHYRHFSVNTIITSFEKYFEPIEIIPFEKISKKKKIIDWCLTNRYFILNNTKLKNILYKYYKKHLFLADSENNCQRLFVKFKKKV